MGSLTCNFYPNGVIRRASKSSPTKRSIARRVSCFLQDDLAPDNELLSGIKIELSPWALGLRRLEGSWLRSNERSSFCSGAGSRGGDDDDGHGHGRGRGGHGDNEEKKVQMLLPLATLIFAALDLGYCIAVWMEKADINLGIEFYGVGLGLVSMLALAAVSVTIGAGRKGYVLGLWASLGAMIWTGERCVGTKERRGLSGFLCLVAASMTVMFCAAFYLT